MDSDRHYASTTGLDGRFHFTGVTPGLYGAAIRLQGFRDKVLIQIQVTADTDANVGTSTLSLLPCNTPGGPICDDFGLSSEQAPILTKGDATLSSGCWMDLDEGRHICSSSTPPAKDPYDFNLTIGQAGEIYLTPAGGAEFALDPDRKLDLGCLTAAYSRDQVRIDGLRPGSKVCVKTKTGRYAQIKFNRAIERFAAQVGFSFVTWIGKPDWEKQLIKR